MKARGRLFRKYVVIIVALVSGVLLASGAIEIYFSYLENKAALVDVQREKAIGAASKIEAFIKEIEHQIGWTTQPQLVAPTAALDQRRFVFLRLLRQVPAITEVSYLDAAGKEQLRVSRLAMDVVGSQTDFSAEPKFREAKAGHTHYGPVYFRKESEPYMTIAMAGSGSSAGVTVVEVNLKFIWDVVSQIKVGKAGQAYAVDGRGNLLAHPDISLVLQKTAFGSLPQVQAAISGSPRPADGGDEQAIVRDFRNRRVLTAYATIPSLRWSVFVEQPLEEAFEPLRASLLRTGLLLLLGIVLSFLASLLLARRMVRPIAALQTGAAKIGAGDLDERIEVHTGDELEALADQFNSMAAQLKESYAGLERKVDARTRELSEALEQQTATSEILRVMNAAQVDLQPVFDAIAASAVRLCDGLMGGVFLVEGQRVLLAAQHNFPREAVEGVFPAPLDSDLITARAIATRDVVHTPDALAEPDYPHKAVAERVGFRGLLSVPMMRDGVPIGAITVARTQAGAFTDKQIGLVTTFASQAVIAIENVRLFTELQERTAQLQVASRHKDEFLANMSHELRTPLNAIIGFSEVMIERMFGDINDKQEEYLNDILSSGRHLLSLINDILDLSKIEAWRMELELTDFNLPAAIDNALTLVHERAARRSLALSQDVDARLGTFRGDERKIKQVLLNLLSNAIKFTPEGGKVEVRAILKGDVIEVSVRDTGVGIAPEDQAVVFEEFRQVGTDLAKKHEGTGLGLALARRFVELHGGNLRLESEVGLGSTFTFSLPVRR